MYSTIKEEQPTDAPDTCGLEFIIQAFVDADRASNLVTHRFRTRFIILLNNAPIYW